MTTLHLLRHGTNDSLKEGRLAGRAPGLHLNAEGRAQAARLAESMRGVPLDAVMSSPLERCRETAAPLAELKGLPVEVREELIELDFGEWTGKRFEEIKGDERWDRFNAFRSGSSTPGGEPLIAAQARMVTLALEARERFPGGHVAFVGHGDPLRSLVIHLLGMPHESIFRIDFGPASWTTIEFGPWSARLVALRPLVSP